MKDILIRLINNERLSREETNDIMLNITREAYSLPQIAALLMAFQMRGITADELLGFRDGLLATGKHVDFTPYKVLDIVGTGGDGKNTFNISTCSCFVVAGAGYKVAKHGNYAATSVSGASNVMEGHGIKFTNDEDLLKKSLEKTNFVYLHAPLFANGMKFVAPVRKALKIPTCFNLLGPLVNPAHPDYQLLGVANLQQMRLYHQVNQKLNLKYGIVNSLDGYDEISLTSDFKLITNTSEHVYAPSDLHFSRVAPEELKGGTTKEDAMKIFDAILHNEADEAKTNVVLANAATAIHIIEQHKTIEECLAIAKESLESGRALKVLNDYIALNS